MRIAHRRGVVEGVVVGAAVAGARRPPVAVMVPAAYPPYYAAQPVAIGVSTPMPPPNVYVNTAPQYPPAAPYGPPPPPAVAYQSPPPPVNPAAAYPPMPSAPPPYGVPASSAPLVLPPAAVAAGPNAAAAAAIETAAIAKAIEKRHFLIVNEANGSVLEIQRGNVKPNALVVVDKRRPDRPGHQIWYMDVEGIIRNKINDFAIESKNNGEHLRMAAYTGDARQKWTFRGNRIVNDVYCNDCIGLKKGIIRLKDDADVIAGPYEGKPYQHWRMEYV